MGEESVVVRDRGRGLVILYRFVCPGLKTNVAHIRGTRPERDTLDGSRHNLQLTGIV